MQMHNPANERIKRQYFAFLKEAKRHSEPTVDAAAKALSRFEAYTRYRDFKAFHFEQAIAFKRHLAAQKGQRSGKNLSKEGTGADGGGILLICRRLAGGRRCMPPGPPPKRKIRKNSTYSNITPSIGIVIHI